MFIFSILIIAKVIVYLYKMNYIIIYMSIGLPKFIAIFILEHQNNNLLAKVKDKSYLY